MRLLDRSALCAVMWGAAAFVPVATRAQSDIAFPATVYAERRARLSNTLGESVIVIPGRYLINPGDGLFKQDPNFWYSRASSRHTRFS